MPRNIDQPEGKPLGVGQEREPQVDGDSPFLFLLQPVGVGAGEGAHQGALAVIDVSRCTDDDMFHGVSPI